MHVATEGFVFVLGKRFYFTASIPTAQQNPKKHLKILHVSLCSEVLGQSVLATAPPQCSVCWCERLEPTCKLARAALCKLHVDGRGCVSDSRDQNT